MGAESKNESPKKKGPKKKNILIEHKPLVVGSMIAVVAIAGIVGGTIFYLSAGEEKRDTLITNYEGLWWYDTLFKPPEIKLYLHNLFDNIKIISQIAEGLFEYEITNEYTRIVPNLALDGQWSSDGLNLTCPLREGVKFHDGTPFNAYAVKWTFDRLHNLLNNISYLDLNKGWYGSDGKEILNRTEIIDNYTVRFVLNRRFVPFKALLCSFQSYILSPSTAPANDFIDIDTNLIGTGPFKYNSSTFLYDPLWEGYWTANTTLLANPDYWDGRPKLNKLIFKFFEENWESGGYQKRYEAMISREIQITKLFPFKPENYTSYPGITLDFYDSYWINYIAIKNSLINATMRKAISYAINYTNILTFEALNNEAGVIRARSPLSKGVLYSNWKDFDVPYFNITIARQVLKDVNWNGTAGALTANDNITGGNEWESLVTNGTPLAIYNYTYIVWRWRHAFYKDVLAEDLKQIGVEINLIPTVNGTEFSDKLKWSHFLQTGWHPDYNDPSNNINPMFSSKADGFANWGLVNDTLVQEWMEEGIIETNETAREQLYYDIQKRLIEEVYPCIWTYTERYCEVHVSNLKGINYYLWACKPLLKEAYFE
ncbi:MAG: ABC transporter substrate-binding protein [Promethearchaeota archaeon]